MSAPIDRDNIVQLPSNEAVTVLSPEVLNELLYPLVVRVSRIMLTDIESLAKLRKTTFLTDAGGLNVTTLTVNEFRDFHTVVQSLSTAASHLAELTANAAASTSESVITQHIPS